MSITAMGEIISELGDLAEAVIDALSRQPVITKTKSTTETKSATKRKPEVAVTKTTTVNINAFHVVFFMVASGVWTPIRDAGGLLKLAWGSTILGDLGEIAGKAPEFFTDMGEVVYGAFEEVFTMDEGVHPFHPREPDAPEDGKARVREHPDDPLKDAREQLGRP